MSRSIDGLILALIVISVAGVIGGGSFVLPVLVLLLVLAGYGIRHLYVLRVIRRRLRDAEKGLRFT